MTRTLKEELAKAIANPTPHNPVEVTREGAYKTGDGDFIGTKRPGADDHKQYKSRFTGDQVIYSGRGHK